MKNIIGIALCLGVMISVAATAPKTFKAEFSGSWQIDTAKSDFAGLPLERAAAIKTVITKSKSGITMERTFKNYPVVFKETLKLDGSETELKESDFIVKRTLKIYKDGLTMIVDSKYHMTREGENPWDYSRTETYALSKDGKSMILTRVTVTPQNTETVKAYYNRVKN